MKVAVGIKALNEEKHIAGAIQSAIEAARPFNAEIILADSGSTDDTIRIARNFPIRIFQLVNVAERCCGAGAQLAFQHVDADYFYLLDGDMELHSEFLALGVEYLEAHRDTAGVGGFVVEKNLQAAEFRIRAENFDVERQSKIHSVDRLDCGGLYRVSAVRQAGYFADRNLHAFEEFELAARLVSQGWKLARIPHPAVEHYGHSDQSYALLWKRLRSGYLGGTGEVLRGAIGKSHLSVVLRRLKHIRYNFVVFAWWLALIIFFTIAPLAGFSILLAPLVLLSIRRRSFELGMFSLVSWNAGALGSLIGFFKARTPPNLPLLSVSLTEGDALWADLEKWRAAQ